MVVVAVAAAEEGGMMSEMLDVAAEVEAAAVLWAVRGAVGVPHEALVPQSPPQVLHAVALALMIAGVIDQPPRVEVEEGPISHDGDGWLLHCRRALPMRSEHRASSLILMRRGQLCG